MNGVNLDGCNLVGFNGLGIDANAHVLGGIAEAQSVFDAFLEQHWFRRTYEAVIVLALHLQ